MLDTSTSVPLHPSVARARAVVLEAETPADRALLAELTALPADAVPQLLSLANDVRAHFCGSAAGVEVLFNAKKGGCSEDCNFCSQAARYASDVAPEPLHTVESFLAAARDAHRRGASEFCIVVAVRGPSETLLNRVCDAVRAIKAELPLHVAVSLGIMRDDQLVRLRAAGTDKVNHNLESSRGFFPQVCTTHSYDERWATCRAVKANGLELCCGGIIGMGESAADRIDFLLELQELMPEEVPVNFLNPRPGTPFGDRPTVEPAEALRFVALTRLTLPRALVRFAGGREITLQGLQNLGMLSGASGLVLGNYLTTEGRPDDRDFRMLEELGFEVLG
jgi:biotin synthase